MAAVDLDHAADFLWRYGRLVDRLLFAARFRGDSPEHVVAALRGYQNDDGGFGNAMEPDVRGPDSHPIHVDMALRYLDDAGTAAPEVVAKACRFLTSVTGPDGGVPGVLESVVRYPRSAHWQPASWPATSLNPTAMIAGLLHALGGGNAFLDRADPFCWGRLAEVREYDGPMIAAVFCFLNHTPDRRRAVQMADEVASRIPDAPFFNVDPPRPGEGYAITPLDLARTPEAMAGGLFAPELLSDHLDALAASQRPDGGWPITFDAATEAAALEWRGRWTVESLIVLQNYARL